MFLVVGSLLSSQNEGCRNTTRLFISHERGNPGGKLPYETDGDARRLA